METYDRVHTSQLLAGHESDRDQGALAIAGDEPHLLQQMPGTGIADQPSLEFKLF